MSEGIRDGAPPSSRQRFWFFVALFGLFLTFRGYRSLEGDQAYRLPILLNQQDAGTFKGDPFVQAFREFNPHRGSLALLDLASRLFGLSAGLFLLFAVAFGLTATGIERLGRAVGDRPMDGLWPAGLLLMFAQAGNIGTNHLFEPILLDRLLALSLAWWGIAFAVEDPSTFVKRTCPLIGLAGLIHPSIGLQLAIVAGTAWLLWMSSDPSTNLSRIRRFWGLLCLGLAILPGMALNLGQPGRLLDGLPAEDFRRLSVELQSPQHMLPYLWRLPQWLAWFCYPLLAGLGCFGHGAFFSNRAGRRLIGLIGVNLAFLLAAYLGIEVAGNLRLTVFQPFRMATLARGLCLVLIAGHCRRLWDSERLVDHLRVVWIAIGLLNDWSLVAVTMSEIAFKAFSPRPWPGLATLAAGLIYLGRHDTESGHLALIGATLGALPVLLWLKQRPDALTATPRRRRLRLAACWVLPLAALAANLSAINRTVSKPPSTVIDWLIKRCRFAPVPIDDVERLAVWCREHTPEGSRFIGPPGPKTFRLWSRRDLAFNRASSPYHARGLDDWSRRFMDHVGFRGDRTAFVNAYLRNRQQLENGYDCLDDAKLSRLADRNGADYVLAAAPSSRPPQAIGEEGLEVIRVEGKYAVYRVSTPTAVARRAASEPLRR